MALRDLVLAHSESRRTPVNARLLIVRKMIYLCCGRGRTRKGHFWALCFLAKAGSSRDAFFCGPGVVLLRTHLRTRGSYGFLHRVAFRETNVKSRNASYACWALRRNVVRGTTRTYLYRTSWIVAVFSPWKELAPQQAGLPRALNLGMQAIPPFLKTLLALPGQFSK